MHIDTFARKGLWLFLIFNKNIGELSDACFNIATPIKRLYDRGICSIRLCSTADAGNIKGFHKSIISSFPVAPVKNGILLDLSMQ